MKEVLLRRFRRALAVTPVASEAEAEELVFDESPEPPAVPLPRGR